MAHILESVILEGGKVGNRAWVARLTGRDPVYAFSRSFQRELDGKGDTTKSGVLRFEIAEPGVYEYRGIGATDKPASYYLKRNSGGADGFLWLRSDDELHFITRERAEELVDAAPHEIAAEDAEAAERARTTAEDDARQAAAEAGLEEMDFEGQCTPWNGPTDEECEQGMLRP
jgi:hypothetical protein